MKAIGYMLAGTALLPGLATGLSPATSATLPSGWVYNGCYALVTLVIAVLNNTDIQQRQAF
jgi:hypothetical protein